MCHVTSQKVSRDPLGSCGYHVLCVLYISYQRLYNCEYNITATTLALSPYAHVSSSLLLYIDILRVFWLIIIPISWKSYWRQKVEWSFEINIRSWVIWCSGKFNSILQSPSRLARNFKKFRLKKFRFVTVMINVLRTSYLAGLLWDHVHAV